MRRRLAVCAAALLVTGSAAQAWAEPPEPAQPAPPAAGLDNRVRQATAEAAESGADIEVAVLDRTTGQVFSDGSTQPFPIASVVKLFIADDLLLRESQGDAELSPADRASLDAMLRASDDSAAQMFWDRGGQNAISARVKERYGLPGTTAPSNGRWDVTQSTATDLVRYYGMLLDGSGGLPPDRAAIIVENLARSTPAGNDGYPQRFGIPDGIPGVPVAVKQGWFCCWNGGNQLHVSTGLIGPDRRYAMAIGSLEPDDAATARDTVTRAAGTVFPAGTA
ncbi:serine hydrolase [Mycobacterium sp. NPDC003323]